MQPEEPLRQRHAPRNRRQLIAEVERRGGCRRTAWARDFASRVRLGTGHDRRPMARTQMLLYAMYSPAACLHCLCADPHVPPGRPSGRPALLVATTPETPAASWGRWYQRRSRALPACFSFPSLHGSGCARQRNGPGAGAPSCICRGHRRRLRGGADPQTRPRPALRITAREVWHRRKEDARRYHFMASRKVTPSFELSTPSSVTVRISRPDAVLLALNA